MDVVRAKYNNYRRPHFQTATMVLERDNRRRVVKRGVLPESSEHIQSLGAKFKALDISYRMFSVIPPIYVRGEAHFEFDRNVSLLAHLCKLVRVGDQEGFELELMKFAGAVGDAAETRNNWWRGEEFVRIFGQVDAKYARPMLCLDPANVDLVFSNVHLRHDEHMPYTMFDYEWTFDFPVPLEYVIWRALNRFTSTLRATTHQRWTIERLCRTVGVDISNQPMFEAMEKKFQAYVYGDGFFHGTPESVQGPAPIVDFEQLASWVASAKEAPLRDKPRVRYPLLRRLLGPALPLALRVKRRLTKSQ